MKYVLILCLSINLVFAIDVTPIKKGDPAPDNGFFVDNPNMQELRNINEKKKILEQKVVKLEELNVITEQRLGLYKEHTNTIERQVHKESLKGNLKGIGGFILGAVLTGLVGYATIQATK